MIKVTAGNNVSRETVIVEETTTLRSVLENVGVDYARGGITLDGSNLKPGDLDKSFKDFGVADRCYLLQIIKADNASNK